MTKTRSQCLALAVKKEERKDKPKLQNDLLHGTNNTSKSKNKITKNRSLTQAQITEVKSEDVKDNKALLASPKKKHFTRSNITTEQITKLIGYIVNDKMSMHAASRKVGMAQVTAYRYYREYQNDPEHKIPLPKIRLSKPLPKITQEKIDSLIRYIVSDGMNVTQASKKADINAKTATRYYTKYLEDPERKVPLLAYHSGDRLKQYTQEEIADLIGYIVRDKMSLVEASKKANMSQYTARRYYLKYLHNPNHGIPDPRESKIRSGKCCTNDQVKSLIGYVVNDGMTLFEASVRANISILSARRYYKQYLNDPEKNIPTPETNNIRKSSKPPTLEKVKNFFCSIIIDQLGIVKASRKANISRHTGQTLYKTYLENPTQEITIEDFTYSVEKMIQFVELVQNKKMGLKEAADAVHLNYNIARKQYHQYLMNPQYEFPTRKLKHYTQEDIKRLIDYVEREKMSVSSAAREINMDAIFAYKYYKKYQNDPERKISVPISQGQTRKNNTFDMYTRIIADIYKNNPSIKPVYGNHYSELDVLFSEIKEESVEEDNKMLLKTTDV